MISAMHPYPFFLNTVDSQENSLFPSQLPSEIVFEILRHLGRESPTDLIQSRRVCKKLYLLLDYPDLWRSIFSRSFPSYALSASLGFKEALKMLRIQSNVANRVYRLTDFKCGVPNAPICALLASGKHLITGGLDRGIRVCSLETGKCLAMFGHAPGGEIAAFAVDQERLFSFCLDQDVICMDMNTLKGLQGFRMGTKPCQALIVSDGKVVSGFADGRIEVRDVKERNLLYTLPGEGNPVYSLAASQGKLVSTSMVETSKVQIKSWDLNLGECLQVWSTFGEPRLLTVLAFDGERLFTGFDASGGILGWDVATGSCMGPFVGHEKEVDSLAIWGSNLISSASDLSIKIWDIAERECLRSLSSDRGRIPFMPVVDQKLFISTASGQTELWDFQAEDNAILEEIAQSLEEEVVSDTILPNFVRNYFNRNSEAKVRLILDRFLRMPKKIQDLVIPPPMKIDLGDPLDASTRLCKAIRDYLPTKAT